MKVIIEAHSTPQVWKLGGSIAKMRIHALSEFETSTGQWVPRGAPGKSSACYLELDLTIIADTLYIPSFEIDSTVDSTTNPFALYTAEIVTEKNVRFIYLANFAVNTLEDGDPSMRWEEIRLFQSRFNLYQLDTSLLRQIAAMIQLAVGELNKASETNLGVIALQSDPDDPEWPIAAAPNDPGMPRAAGLATLVGGTVTVFESAVSSTCGIILTGQGDGAAGTMRVSSKVDGFSFTITSTEGADDGVVAWVIIEP